MARSNPLCGWMNPMERKTVASSGMSSVRRAEALSCRVLATKDSPCSSSCTADSDTPNAAMKSRRSDSVWRRIRSAARHMVRIAKAPGVFCRPSR